MGLDILDLLLKFLIDDIDYITKLIETKRVGFILVEKLKQFICKFIVHKYGVHEVVVLGYYPITRNNKWTLVHSKGHC